jgi:hypothetical protein
MAYLKYMESQNSDLTNNADNSKIWQKKGACIAISIGGGIGIVYFIIWLIQIF